MNPTQFHHPRAFWLGTMLIIAGVVAHIPMFIAAKDMHYYMAGMEMGLLMIIGMYAIIIGTLIVFYGLLSKNPFKFQNRRLSIYADNHIVALDNAKLSAAHWKLYAVLIIALIVDVMKPATLGFVLPGTAAEYGLSKAEVALVPFAGILGTTMGSFIWGWLGDTIGRRASILFAAMIFIGTSICGAMPSFGWNVFMCWLMGFGAGGMLPITFALLAEIMPKKHRGGLIVLLGAIGTIGGYLAASAMAALLEPQFGWRILWFLGLPTGVLLIFLNRHIPESPRFLLAQGDKTEAYRIMALFGVKIVNNTIPASDLSNMTAQINRAKAGRFADMFHPTYRSLTNSVGLYGMAWGLVNFGFLLWLPLNLREMGMSVSDSGTVLAQSALIAFPATLFAAWLYQVWSSKKTLVLFALLMMISLIGFIIVGHNLVNQPVLMSILLISLLASSSGVIAMLSPYTAEVFPVHIRSTASGWSAGCSKGAGVITLGASVMGISLGMTTVAVIAIVPTLVASIAIAWKGVETRGLSLEWIQRK